jgi:hypothetical protein
LQYKCENCRRKFEFWDEIEFCPYCGKPFATATAVSAADTSDNTLIQTIDAIWGDEARIRREFSNITMGCIYLINDYSEQSIVGALPNQDIAKYAKNYAAIKQSNNRKTLLARIDQFLDSIDVVIDNLSNCIPIDTISKLESAHENIESIVKELYDFLGFRYEANQENMFAEEKYSAEVLYSRDQLRYLYELVLVAYGKYKKCVADNNMFAAFASTSDYGVLVQPWRKWLSRLSQDATEEDEEQAETPEFDEVVDYMKQQNAKRYLGLLDEDFVPHVDAFWHGLEMLCAFIDNHISVDYNSAHSRITTEERERILRNITSTSFYVSNERLEGLLELKKRFEEKMESSNNGEV